MNESAETAPNAHAMPQTKDHVHQGPPPPQAASSANRSVAADRKSPLLATVLSIMPGLGQVYVGYYQRGFIHAIVFAIVVSLLVADALGPLMPLAAIFVAFFWFYNLVDAGRRAALYNRALEGGQPLELPDDLQLPGLRGSVAGGVTLVLVGLILLANTRFGMSLDWIEEWWPAAIVAFGGYLVYKAAQDGPGD